MKLSAIFTILAALFAYASVALADARSDFLPGDFRVTDKYTFYVKSIANQSKDSYQPSARLELCADNDCDPVGNIYTAARAITPMNASWTFSFKDAPKFVLTGQQILAFLDRHPHPADDYNVLLSLGRVFEGKYLRSSVAIIDQNAMRATKFKYFAQFVGKTSENIEEQSTWTFSKNHNFHSEMLDYSIESRKDSRAVPFLRGFAEISLER